jgi:Mn2+/Fe2+ NRAMP family transporter
MYRKMVESRAKGDVMSEPPRMPRWVKVFAIVGAVVLVLLAVMLLAGHGPGQHMGHGR